MDLGLNSRATQLIFQPKHLLWVPKRTVSMRRFFLALKNICLNFCLFVCFVALRPKSTAMVMAGRSVHLSTLFPGQA